MVGKGGGLFIDHAESASVIMNNLSNGHIFVLKTIQSQISNILLLIFFPECVCWIKTRQR